MFFNLLSPKNDNKPGRNKRSFLTENMRCKTNVLKTAIESIKTYISSFYVKEYVKIHLFQIHFNLMK